MTPATAFAGKHVALFGLGGSGLATARALVAGGAQVSCWDDGAASREKASTAGLAVVDLAQADWSKFDSLVLAPGVPLTHPTPHWTVLRAKQAGVEIIGDIEVFCRERARIAPDAPFVAITGTNGKSTTTALVAHLLACFGADVQMGGNIGTPVLALQPPSSGRVHVLELSSFQIDLTPSLAPSVGVLLNVTPDHLDRHGTMENYAGIKERLVAKADHAVIAIDDDFTRIVAARLRERGRAVTTVSINGTADFSAAGTTLYRGGEFLADLAGIGTLRGAHNAQNALAAVATLLAVESHRDPETLQRALKTFGGLPHRMEEVGRAARVLFVNDSKATNADAAEKALLSFDDIFWILGGRAKTDGIEPLRPLFGRISKAYLIGEAAAAFIYTLTDSDPKVPCITAGTLEDALDFAWTDARESKAREPVVLLSPACASYDQFPNYEVRGDRFRDLVRAILASQTGAAA